MKEMGYGEDYKYSHDFKDGFVEQEYLPDAIAGQKFYEPGSGWEEKFRSFLKARWKGKYGY
jgi:putative ATPase